MKINNLDDLKQEKLRLKLLGEQHLNLLVNDLELIKRDLNPLHMLGNVTSDLIPEAIRHSPLVTKPLDFLTHKIFKTPNAKPKNYQSEPAGTGHVIKTVALGILETTATFLISRYIRRKL